jgi:hypothetical protein
MSVKNRILDEEQDQLDTAEMGEAMREDLVHWIGRYGYKRLGPFLLGAGFSMVEQAVGHHTAVSMLQDILKEETGAGAERLQ